MKRKTVIKLSITAAIIIALSLWVNSRYSVWFGNPDEAPYAPLSEPGRILLTFGDSNELSRNISWQCDSVVKPSNVTLIDTLAHDTVKIDAAGEVFQSRSGKAAFYVARLRSLKPNTFYTYCVTTGNQSSDWYNFSTPDHSTDKDFSFMFVGDVQDTINGITNRYLRNALKSHPETEFIFFGGDLTERPTDAYWGETFRSLDSIATNMPIINITGNHDYLKKIIRKLERRFSLIFSYFLDSMVGENQVYTLRYGDAQFFLLDSNREFFYLWDQQDWLEEQLKKSDAKWKIVALHHPLHSLKRSGNNFFQRHIFDDLIKENGVDLVLQGHEHAYGRLTTHDENGMQKTPVYTISHCSPKNYKIHNAEEFEAVDTLSKIYQLIRISGDTLKIKSFNADNHSVIDSVDIIKSTDKVQIIAAK